MVEAGIIISFVKSHIIDFFVEWGYINNVCLIIFSQLSFTNAKVDKLSFWEYNCLVNPYVNLLDDRFVVWRMVLSDIILCLWYLQDITKLWSAELTGCSLIFYRAASSNRAVLFGGKTPALSRWTHTHIFSYFSFVDLQPLWSFQGLWLYLEWFYY